MCCWPSAMGAVGWTFEFAQTPSRGQPPSSPRKKPPEGGFLTISAAARQCARLAEMAPDLLGSAGSSVGSIGGRVGSARSGVGGASGGSRCGGGGSSSGLGSGGVGSCASGVGTGGHGSAGGGSSGTSGRGGFAHGSASGRGSSVLGGIGGRSGLRSSVGGFSSGRSRCRCRVFLLAAGSQGSGGNQGGQYKRFVHFNGPCRKLVLPESTKTLI